MDEEDTKEVNNEPDQQLALTTIKYRVENDWRAGELPGQIAGAMGGKEEDWELLRRTESQIKDPTSEDLVVQIYERMNANIDTHLEGGRSSLTEPYEHDFWPRGVPNPEPQFFEKPLKMCREFNIDRSEQILGEFENFLIGWKQMLAQVTPEKYDRFANQENSLIRRYFESLESYIKWSLKFGHTAENLGEDAIELFEFRKKYPDPQSEKMRHHEREELKRLAEKLNEKGISSVFDNEEIMQWLTT